MKTYNKRYKVIPRYYSDYKRQGLCILTLDKAVYTLTLKHFRQYYTGVIIARQGKYYTINARIKEALK